MRGLSICGGNGVFLYPLRNYIIGNIEPRGLFHTPNEEQWYANFSKPITRDSKQFQGSKVDFIIGAPDCGHSSVLSYSRSKKMSDPSLNDSLNLFVAEVNAFKPTLFFMENLPKALEKMDLESLFPHYHFKVITGSVTMYGNSQVNRVRSLLIGSRRPLLLKYFNKPNDIRGPKTCFDLLGDLKKEDLELGHIREPINSEITLYGGFKASLKDIRAAWLSTKDTKWVVKDRNFKTAPGVYRNKALDHPRTARKANRQFNHWGLMMSPRELARIQGVPDKFKIYIDPKRKQYWINKGRTTVTKCPPYEMGRFIKNCLEKLCKKENSFIG
jgi:site-specific DNA-cytosine methylase